MTIASTLISNNTSTNLLPKRPAQKKQNRLGPYNLLQTLGEGEFGKVKLGIHTETGQEVAIKLIKKEGAGSDTRINKVEREISVLKTLNHPYIVKLYNVVETEKYIGIILEYASGGELFEYILAHRYLKEKDAKRFFAQLISSVQYMHKRKIVHRDLKLENLLLDKNRNVIVTDFGFANQFSSSADDMMATTCGSPCYAAPELVVNAGLYAGSAVDIWSCGVILYAMLCGFLPFDDDPSNPDSDNINQLYRYILSTHLMFPSYVSIDARDLLEKMLVPDPVKRCSLDYIITHPWLQTYREFLKKDAAFLDGEPTKSSKASSTPAKGKNDMIDSDETAKKLILTSSVSTTVKSTTPKKIMGITAASRKTHIPVATHDRFAPVANEKYLLTSNKSKPTNNQSSKTGAFRHFSIGRSTATTTPVLTTTTATRVSKVPNFISRKPVKKEEEEVALHDMFETYTSTDLNPEKSLSSPQIVQDSKTQPLSAFGSIRKNQRRGTDKLINFFTGGRASHIPVVAPKNEDLNPFSLGNHHQQQETNTDDLLSDINNSQFHDANERMESSIDDANQDTARDLTNEQEGKSLHTVHSNSEGSTIGDSTTSLHVQITSNSSLPLSPVSLVQEQNTLVGDPADANTSAVHIETALAAVPINEDSSTVANPGTIVTLSTAVNEIIPEETEEIVNDTIEETTSIMSQQQLMKDSSVCNGSILSEHGGSVSINGSIVSFKDAGKRTPITFASQKGGTSSLIMRQQQIHRRSIDNNSSIISSIERHDNASISSSGALPQPEVSASTRLNTSKIMGDGGRKAMAAVRRSIYRKHKSQPPASQLSENSSQRSSIISSTRKEPILSFNNSRFKEAGHDSKQSTQNGNRNTWSSSTILTSAGESNVALEANSSTLTSNNGLPPKKTGKKMMDWIKKKSQARESKTPKINTQAPSKSKTPTQILTKSRGTSNNAPTPVVAPTLNAKVTNNDKKITNDNKKVTNDNKKISNAPNKNKEPKVVSILGTTSVNVTPKAVHILPTPAPSPTPQSPTNQVIDEAIVIPSESNKSRARALSSNGTSLISATKKNDQVDKRIQYHQGAIDRSALTSQSPTEVIKEVVRILRILGIDARPETNSPFILRCCRRKAKAFISADLLQDKNDDDEDFINESAITSASEVSLLTPSTKDGLSLSSHSFDNTPDMRNLEPIYGDASIDNGDEIRFIVEICRFKNLPGLYSVDMRRLRGSAWAYRFLYHKLLDFLDLGRNGSYIRN